MLIIDSTEKTNINRLSLKVAHGFAAPST